MQLSHQPATAKPLTSSDFGFTPFNDLQAMKLLQDIEQKIAGNNDPISHGVRTWMGQRKSATYIIAQLKGMAIDNPDLMGDVVGMKLVNRIINFK